MKILVFEYITGGGFNKQKLPDSLASEGLLMLRALLDNLSAINGIELVVMLDSRVTGSVCTTGINTVIIKPEQNSHEEFARLTLHCDAVWPIAPEFDNILQTLCQVVELSGKLLLTSPAHVVAITGNKFATYENLKQHHIATVPTQLLKFRKKFIRTMQKNSYPHHGEWMIKPVDGAGCTGSYLMTDPKDVEHMCTQKSQYVIQPHIQGKKTSLSCLFRQGNGWLLCANLQQFKINNGQYYLTEIIVNYHTEPSRYQNLVDNIALALPELWGYAGIDLIETAEQVLVLEINPRLTTSFVGIHAAIGINVAENVLQLLEGNPSLNPVYNRQIAIKLKHNDTH